LISSISIIEIICLNDGAVQIHCDHRMRHGPPVKRRTPVMTSRILILATLATASLANTAMADDRTFLMPPLYREQARATATVRPTSELTTTPSLTPRVPATRRVIAETADVSVR
jgi:hypothetical protein